MTRTTLLAAGLGLLLAGATHGAAPPAAAAAAPEGGAPFDLMDATRIQAGKTRFNSMCAAYCHGFEGGGGKTPAFKGRNDLKPEDVYKTIAEGRRGADIMPAWGHSFSQEKIWELVAYIMSLTRQPAPAEE